MDIKNTITIDSCLTGKTSWSTVVNGYWNSLSAHSFEQEAPNAFWEEQYWASKMFVISTCIQKLRPVTPSIRCQCNQVCDTITWGKLKIFKYNKSFGSAKLSATFTSKGILLVGSTSPLAMAMASVWERFVLGIKVKTHWLLPYWEKNYVQQPNIRRESI